MKVGESHTVDSPWTSMFTVAGVSPDGKNMGVPLPCVVQLVEGNFALMAQGSRRFWYKIPAPKPEPKPAATPAPKPAAKVAPKPAAKVAPKPALKAAKSPFQSKKS